MLETMLSPDVPKIWGFIGLGQMGGPMARNFHAKLPTSHKLFIYDANPEVAQRVATELAGSKVATGVAEIGRNCDIIISCLPNPPVAKTVYNQVVQVGSKVDRSARLIIDTSTIDPKSSQFIHKALAESNLGHLVDAPMSGGVAGASAGTLTFMVGGPQAEFQQVQPILEMMGKRFFHCGPQGTGLAEKLANNYLLAISNIATAEAMNLGMKSGLDPAVLAQIINSGTGRCWSSEVNNPVPGVLSAAPASRKYKGGFVVGHMNKDLRLAIAASSEAKAPLLLGPKAEEIYTALENNQETRSCDFSVVYRLLDEGVWCETGPSAKI